MKLMVIFNVLVLLVALPLVPACGENWYWGYEVYCGGQYSTGGGFGIDSSSVIGYDANDYLVNFGPTAYCGTYHVNGVDGWAGPTGFYRTDTRSPLPLTPGSSYTWRFYIWADPTAYGSQIHLDVGFLVRAPAGLKGSLTLISQPAAIDSGPAIGTVWDVNGSAVQPVLLPMFKSADGREGYVFDLAATVVPEPSSLAALLCDLVGAGGVVVGRRRMR